jgi:hypothetical protein
MVKYSTVWQNYDLTLTYARARDFAVALNELHLLRGPALGRLGEGEPNLAYPGPDT